MVSASQKACLAIAIFLTFRAIKGLSTFLGYVWHIAGHVLCWFFLLVKLLLNRWRAERKEFTNSSEPGYNLQSNVAEMKAPNGNGPRLRKASPPVPGTGDRVWEVRMKVLLIFFLITLAYYSLFGNKESAVFSIIYITWLVVAGFVGELGLKIGFPCIAIATIIPLIAGFGGIVPTPFVLLVMAMTAALCFAGVVPALILRCVIKSWNYFRFFSWKESL